MPRIVVVSNRVGPLSDAGKAGGLAVALIDVLRTEGGLWFGWTGETSEEGTYGPLHAQEDGNVATATIDMTPTDYDEFYAGFANRALWPTMHYRLDLIDFDKRLEEGYRRINERFAARLVPLLRPDDVVWVHDYHFFMLGAYLRAAGVQNPIGYFLHIPFPVPEILTALPNHVEVVKALLAYDLVGFQTSNHLNAFRRYLIEEAGGSAGEAGAMSAFGATTVAAAFPIGIDAQTFSEYHETAEGAEHYARASGDGSGTQIVGVDRCDYSKGLPQRFEAFERLLDLYPDYKNRVTLLQVAPPSRSEVRAYAEIQSQLEGLSGRINGRFAELDWSPIHFLGRSFPRRSLAGIYRASAVGLVTPLRDGMNLVAKEYVAAQDPENPGVLILSRFAGAVEELSPGALVVNPYSIDELAEAMRRAIEMPLEERKARWRPMFANVTQNTAAAWSRSFLDRLAAVRAGQLSDPIEEAPAPVEGAAAARVA